MDGQATLGICATGFFFLAGWCWYLHGKYAAIWATSDKVDEIHKALLGDMYKEGLISKTRRLEENCRIRHGALVADGHKE